MDEEDFITCTRDVVEGKVTLFAADKRYPIRTGTVQVTPLTQRRNRQGEMENLELSGQELAIYITGEHGKEVCFMSNPRHAPPDFQDRFLVMGLSPLIDHFHIPEVLHVASVHRKASEQNLQALSRLQELLANSN